MEPVDPRTDVGPRSPMRFREVGVVADWAVNPPAETDDSESTDVTLAAIEEVRDELRQAIDDLSRKLQLLDDSLAHRTVGIQQIGIEVASRTAGMAEQLDELADTQQRALDTLPAGQERIEAQLAELITQTERLRRRMTLRARPQQLAPEQIEEIAAAVAAVLRSDPEGRAGEGDATSKRRRRGR